MVTSSGCQILPCKCGLPEWQSLQAGVVVLVNMCVCVCVLSRLGSYNITNMMETWHHFLFMRLLIQHTNITHLREVTQPVRVRQKSPAALV